MPLYQDVVAAAGETATAILAQRTNIARVVRVGTDGGSTASVEWSTNNPIVKLELPSLPPDAFLTRAEADRLVGYVAHECCHVIHTDWTAWTRAVRDGPAVRDLVNCLEDVRIEQAEIAAGHYPALRSLLASLLTQKHAEAIAEAGKSKVTIGQKLAHGPYVCTVLGRMANGYSVPTAHSLRRDLSPKVRALVTMALRELPKCRDTEAVRKLAHRLLKAQERQNQQNQPQEGPGKPQEGPPAPEGSETGQQPESSQTPSDASQEGNQPQDGQGEEGQGEGEGQEGDGETQGEEAQGEDQPGEGRTKGGDGDPEAGGQAINPDDMHRMIEDASARHDGKTVRQRTGESFAHLLPLARNDVFRRRHHGADPDAARALTAILPGSSVLHGQIARMLVSEEMTRVTHHETSGRLDRRALGRMRTGATDVYSRRDERPAVQTALVLLLDLSSSMDEPADHNNPKGPSRLTMAKGTCWALARAAEDAGALVQIVGFHTARERHEGADLIVVKDWTLTTMQAAGALATCGTGNTTPLSPAIVAASRMLREAPGSATRRITMVLTDGQCNYRAAAVTAACRIAAARGVETVGIGMNCDQVIEAFPDGYSVNVTSLEQLAKTGLGTLVRMLEDADRGR